MRFSKQEDRHLRRLFKAKLSHAEIARRMGRPKASVQYAIDRLGLRGEKPLYTSRYPYRYRTPADIEFLRSLR